jgi:hypothetical protein
MKIFSKNTWGVDVNNAWRLTCKASCLKKIELRPLISGFDFALLEVRNLCVASRLQWLSDYPRWLIVSIINVQVTAIIDFIIPADNYNQTLLITCQLYTTIYMYNYKTCFEHISITFFAYNYICQRVTL